MNDKRKGIYNLYKKFFNLMLIILLFFILCFIILSNVDTFYYKSHNNVLSKAKNQYSLNIGKITTWHTNNVLTKDITWKLLYQDDNYKYLIANDYVKISSQIPTKDGNSILENVNPYTGEWSNQLLQCYSGNDNVNNIGDWYVNKGESNNKNKATDYLLDIDIWRQLYDGNGAEWVIGGPTLELLKASIEDYDLNLTLKVATRSALRDSSYYIVDKINIPIALDGTLYISNSDKASATWLAAPGFYDRSFLWRADDNGNLYNDDHSDNDTGFRPVVCIDSNTYIGI